MLVLMYNVPQMESEREKERQGELVYLTSVNICIRKLPHMLRHRLCQHILRTTVRMRNFSYASPGLCFSVSASVMQYYDFYTLTHLSSLPPTTMAFVQFGFPFLFEFPLLFLLVLSSLDCSFDYISINWWQFYVCTFQHLSAFEMFIFYDALGRFSVFFFFFCFPVSGLS